MHHPRIHMTVPRLLMTLVAMLAIAARLLRLRHEPLVVKHHMADPHNALQSKQAKLSRQQIDIATFASRNLPDVDTLDRLIPQN